MRNGCYEFQCSVLDARDTRWKLEDISVVREFSCPFPYDLPSVLIEREIKFGIDVMPETQLISRALSRMAPVELKELKTQLQELLDSRFIRPSVLPWGCIGSIFDEEG